MKNVQQTFLLVVSVAGFSGCKANNTDINRPYDDGVVHAEIAASGYATILDAPPAPFTPVTPGEAEPKSAKQIADEQQFMRVTKFQGRVMDQVDALVETLRREESGNFVSVYYDNEGDPSVIFQFADS